MKKITFQWDEKKNKLNQKEHGVSFEEAGSVFYDENAVQYYDPDHSDEEDRFLMLGLSNRLRVLIVSHCFREDDSVIRIISARKAVRKERKEYPAIL
jgi:uncharacterized DUF497 family protein